MQKLHLTALSEEEIEAIHQASLQILDQVGITMQFEPARLILAEAGARLVGNRVLIPASLVSWALAQCPHTVSIRGRNGAAITLGDGNLHWHNLGGARDVFDPMTRNIRPALVNDVVLAARLLDNLAACTCVTPFFTPQDVHGELMSLAMYRHTLPHTTKPVYGPGIQTPLEVQYAVRMAEVIGPASETTFLAVSPVSPLNFPDHLTGAIMETARYGIPFGPLPCPTAGATAPITISGAVAQQNAEVLASIVLAQLVHPGLPIIYCGRLAMMEPRTGASVWGGVELGLASAATVQVAHYYGLPVNVYGFSTNSHTLDLQNGFERSLNAIIPALAGADELSGIGEMQAGVASSYAQMVVDNEIALSVHRLRAGFSADADALAVDVVAAAMDGTRNFLGQQHTRRHLRAGEILITRLAERGTWSEWERQGKNGLVERAIADVERILAAPVAMPLDDYQESALDEIMRSATQELVH